jgi:nucleoside-diphosphate-sugar epimerase
MATDTSAPPVKATTALVTGCAGFIGSQLSESLIGAGITVRGVDLFTDYYDPAVKRRNLAGAQKSGLFELHEGDLNTLELPALLKGVDLVFHLAGQPGVRVSWSEGFNTYVERNVLATQRLLEAARESDIKRLVYASSSSVYGNAQRYPTTELDLPQPHSPYGVTKLAAEHLCALYSANWSVPAVSLRYFSVYGPRQRPDMGFARFFTAISRGEPIPIFGSGEQIRDFTYVGDVVNATIAAGTLDLLPGSMCNVAGGSSISVLELIPLLERVTGQAIARRHEAAQPGDVQRTGGSIEAARLMLGWEPKVDIETGLRTQYAWFESNVTNA